MLRARYWDINLRVVHDKGKCKGQASISSWWADLLLLEKDKTLEVFNSTCKVSVGNSYRTSFWHSSWMLNGVLKLSFPSLFAAYLLQDVSVATMSGWRDDIWHWFDLGLPQACFSGTALADEMALL